MATKKNRTTTQTSRVTELEKDLIDDNQVSEQQIQTGTFRRETAHADSKRQSMVASRRKLGIKQGLRIRHPDDVLHRYDGVYSSSHKAASVYGANLIEEDERTVVPENAKKLGDLAAHQLGLVTTAKKNAELHERKLESMFIVGV